MQHLLERFAKFIFPADSDKWLAVLRIGLGLEVALYCLSLRGDWNHLFTGNGNGLISRDLPEAILSIQSAFVPRLGWLVDVGSHLGLTEGTVLSAAWALLFCAGCSLIMGFFCRSSAIIAWFLHLCAVKSGDFMSYGMDNFTTIGLFYLMIAPLPDVHALDSKLWKSQPKDPHILGFYRRILQIHICLIYFFSGLTKCMGVGWWTGASLWRAMTRPPFNVIPPDLLLAWRYVLPVVGAFVCLLEVGYPLFIWIKKTRLIWLACVLGVHAAIGVTMGLYLFALIMIVLNVAAFGAEFISIPLEKGKWWIFADRSS